MAVYSCRPFFYTPQYEGTLPGAEPFEAYSALGIPLNKIIRVPLNRRNVSVVVREIPSISATEGASLHAVVFECITTFQSWYASRKSSATFPSRLSGIIFVFSQDGAKSVADYLNSGGVAAAGCVCQLDCETGSGCRVQTANRAVAYHSGLSTAERTEIFDKRWVRLNLLQTLGMWVDCTLCRSLILNYFCRFNRN